MNETTRSEMRTYRNWPGTAGCVTLIVSVLIIVVVMSVLIGTSPLLPVMR